MWRPVERVIASLPADMLVRDARPSAARMATAALLLVTGIVLLFVPGPGVVCLLLALIVFGKTAWLRRHLARPDRLAVLNDVRRRHGAPPFVIT